MPNTYTQLYIQIVFAVKGRQNLISENNREELQKFITGIVQNREQKLLSIFAMPDHVHILVGLRPVMALAELVQVLKKESTNFINEKKWLAEKFAWQEGDGFFSHSHAELDKVIQYILNQKKHHAKRSFREEYLEILQRCEVGFEEKYLFEWISEED